MLSTICRALWGDLSREELKKFGLLSGVFFFIIGTYWLVRSLKDAVFLKTVGPLYLPYAKMVSLVTLVFVLMLYAKLVDLLEKSHLIYLLSTLFGLYFGSLAYFISHPTIGLANTITDKYRLLGWMTYVGIECCGTLMTFIFWSFVTSAMDTTSAKKGYPVIIAGAQGGSVLGSLLVMQASTIGIGLLMLIASASILMVPVMIKLFITRHPGDLEVEKQVAKKKPTGMLEGLRLLLSKPYLIGILAVSTLYEVVGEIMNFQMKFLANSAYHSAEKVAEFMGFFGVLTNGLALLFAVIGTSFFIRRFGFTFCLVAYPVTIACVVSCAWAFNSLWVLLASMVTLKGLSYALNNPCKEIMYIPTSKDIKFKAKSWVDGFGGRTAKGTGASVVAFFPVVSELIFYGSIISLGIIGFWVAMALFVGRTNQRLVQDGSIIE